MFAFTISMFSVNGYLHAIEDTTTSTSVNLFQFALKQAYFTIRQEQSNSELRFSILVMVNVRNKAYSCAMCTLVEYPSLNTLRAYKDAIQMGNILFDFMFWTTL